MMRETSAESKASEPNMIVRVQWKTRTAGFDSGSVESIIQKACAHFHLGPAEKKHILMGEVEGIELELSDDMLKHLASGALVKLVKAPVTVVDSDSDNEDAASTLSGETRSYAESEPPVYPRHRARSPSFDGMSNPSPPPIRAYPYQPSQYQEVQTYPPYVPMMPPPFSQGPTQLSPSMPSHLDFYGNPFGIREPPKSIIKTSITVETVSGKRIPVLMSLTDTVGSLKKKLQDICGFPTSQQQLLNGSCEMRDSFTLSDYGISGQSVLKLVLGPQSSCGFTLL